MSVIWLAVSACGGSAGGALGDAGLGDAGSAGREAPPGTRESPGAGQEAPPTSGDVAPRGNACVRCDADYLCSGTIVGRSVTNDHLHLRRYPLDPTKCDYLIREPFDPDGITEGHAGTPGGQGLVDPCGDAYDLDGGRPSRRFTPIDTRQFRLELFVAGGVSLMCQLAP